jgi:hypothetical protein
MESIELEKNNERKYTFFVTNRHGALPGKRIRKIS